MKTLIAISILSFSSFFSFSQNKAYSDSIWGSKRMIFGFNFGLNQSNIAVTKYKADFFPSESPEITNKLGFSLGILTEIELLDWLHLSPKAELIFFNGQINNPNISGITTITEINIALMPHVLFITKNKSLPYIFIGPNFNLPRTKGETMVTEYFAGRTFAMDFGLGLNLDMGYFFIAPELRYSLGTSDFLTDLSGGRAKFHNVSVLFNFKG